MRINNWITCLLLTILGFALLYQTQAFASGINAVVASISEYQDENGGFKTTRDQDPTLEATAQALFLTSLFGNKRDIDTEGAKNYIKSLHNKDNGYSNQPGQPSDIESTRNAILGLKHLGVKIDDVSSVASFIDSLFDKDTKLYANTFSDTGNVKATAVAYQTLNLLNQLDTSAVKEKTASIKSSFFNLIKTESNKKYFFSLTSDNYYAIVVAYYSGIDLGDIIPWARYFLERQVRDGPYAGGFYSDQESSDITPEDTSNAVAALSILQKLQPSSKLLDYIAPENLINYVSLLPRSLKAAYFGFTTFARTNLLQKTTFKISPLYDYQPTLPRPSPPSHVIIQGSVVRPAVSIRTFFGLPQPALETTLTILREKTGEKFNEVLRYNEDNQLYYSESLQYHADELGEVSFQYLMKWSVPDLDDELTLSLEDDKVVGYDLNIVAKATSPDDEEIKVGDFVVKGTQFEFEVKLGNVQSPKPTLLSGDFDVVFSVLDSSNAVINRLVFDGRKNSKSVKFDYELKSNNLPAGDLVFKFEVGDQKNGYFSVDKVKYILPLTMVATNVQFSGATGNAAPTYEIGETIKVEMQPGSLPDSETVEFYAANDHENNSIRRKFLMQVSSVETGEGLFVLDGIPKVEGKIVSYVFSLPINPSFSSIGTNAVSFLYVTASGQHVLLKNYDVKTKKFSDEEKKLSYSVKTELHVTNLKSEIQSGKLDYGNDVKLSFQVKDEISKKLIYAENAYANVYLVLKHHDGKKIITSTKQAATQVMDKQTNKPSLIQITWSVNPNAIKGQGHLELVVVGTDKKEVAIFEENTKNPWKVDVDIGGSISVAEKKFVDILDDEDAIFLVEFELSCNGKVLKDAVLQADVTYGSEKVFALPVTEGREGLYTVSWVLPVEVARSGSYSINIYRDVDITSGVEGQKTDPLFSSSLYHPGASTKFPIKLEVVALVGLGSAFFWLVFQKMEIEGTRQKNKNKKKTK